MWLTLKCCDQLVKEQLMELQLVLEQLLQQVLVLLWL